MIFYPLRSLIEAGIDEVMIVTGGRNPGDFMRLLGDGKQFGFKRLYYSYQRGQGGIADALKLAEDFASGESVCVVLGDNIFKSSLRPQIARFGSQSSGARILLKKVRHPERFGVARFVRGELTEIVEKPKRPPSPYAVIGVYFYDARVFDIIKTLKPSARGELEIADVTNHYLRSGQLSHGILTGWWSDAGTVESLHRSAGQAAKTWFRPGAKETFWEPFDRWVAAKVDAGMKSTASGKQAS
ncbi:MAG: sugar phosphate nucleotidyltransferase [Candidatus Zixiibacteriota bacterium]